MTWIKTEEDRLRKNAVEKKRRDRIMKEKRKQAGWIDTKNDFTYIVDGEFVKLTDSKEKRLLHEDPEAYDNYAIAKLEARKKARWIKKYGTPEDQEFRRAELERWKEGANDRARNKRLQESYGINLDQYNELLTKQEHKCPGCERGEKENGKRLAVDHDHETGAVRGLLCSDCNLVLGLARDDWNVLKNLIDYLAEYKELK